MAEYNRRKSKQRGVIHSRKVKGDQSCLKCSLPPRKIHYIPNLVHPDDISAQIENWEKQMLKADNFQLNMEVFNEF